MVMVGIVCSKKYHVILKCYNFYRLSLRSIRIIVNFSIIAKQYNIQNITVSDIIKDLEKKKLVKVKKLGGSKIVRLR